MKVESVILVGVKEILLWWIILLFWFLIKIRLNGVGKDIKFKDNVKLLVGLVIIVCWGIGMYGGFKS